jgi:hypothetical protein
MMLEADEVGHTSLHVAARMSRHGMFQAFFNGVVRKVEICKLILEAADINGLTPLQNFSAFTNHSCLV